MQSKGTYRLSDSSKLFITLVVVCPERIEESCFPVVYMAHDRDDGGPLKIVACLAFLVELSPVHQLYLSVELNAGQLDCVIR